MKTSAEVIKKVVTRTVKLELNDDEYQNLLKAQNWYKTTTNGHNFYQRTAFDVVDVIVTAVTFSESETT